MAPTSVQRLLISRLVCSAMAGTVWSSEPSPLNEGVAAFASLAESQSAPRLVAHRRRDPNQSGYLSFRQVRGSAGCDFGARSSRKLSYGATNGSGADTV